jgi:D-lactate dehydrogenase
LATALRAGQGSFALAGRTDVLLTPHNAFNTREAVERKAEQSARQIETFLRTGNFLWPVR